MIIPISKNKTLHVSALTIAVAILHLALALVIVYEGFVLYNLYNVLSDSPPGTGIVRTSRVNFDAHSKAQERYLNGKVIEPSNFENLNNPFSEYERPEEED